MRSNEKEKARRFLVQCGVLPYRFSQDAALEILLVTTRGTMRWIVPEGWPIKGLRPAKSAARAKPSKKLGSRKSCTKPRGVFAYDKLRDEAGGTTICEVKVYVAFARRYNETWLVARHGYKTPAKIREEQTMPQIAIDPITLGRLSKRSRVSQNRTAQQSTPSP